MKTGIGYWVQIKMMDLVYLVQNKKATLGYLLQKGDEVNSGVFDVEQERRQSRGL